MTNVIVVTGGKGGVGKTLSCANLAAALAQNNKKVLIIDADIGLRNMDITLGLDDRVVYDVVDAATGRCDVKRAIIADKDHQNLYFMAASQGESADSLTPTMMKSVIARLDADFDFILVDCPAGIGHGFENAVAAADSAIIVVNPENASLRDADKVIGLLQNRGIDDARLLINRYDAKAARRGKQLDIDETLDRMSLTLVGVVPEYELGCDLAASDSKSRAYKAYNNAARRILGERVELNEVKYRQRKRKSGFFRRREEKL